MKELEYCNLILLNRLQRIDAQSDSSDATMNSEWLFILYAHISKSCVNIKFENYSILKLLVSSLISFQWS